MKHAQCNVLIFNLLIVNKVIAKVVRKEKKVEMIVIWWKAFGGSHLVEVEKTERATPAFSFKGSSFERKPSQTDRLCCTDWREILKRDVQRAEQYSF